MNEAEDLDQEDDGIVWLTQPPIDPDKGTPSDPFKHSHSNSRPSSVPQEELDDCLILDTTQLLPSQDADKKCAPQHAITPKAAPSVTPSHAALEQPADLVVPQHGVRPAFPFSHRQSQAHSFIVGQGAAVPASINRFLRQYQREGVQFFYTCYRNGHGGILGDDMGLGKTVQVIAFLAAIMAKTGVQRDDELRRITALRNDEIPAGKQKANRYWATCLIVCPASVVANWQIELDTWGYFEHAILDKRSYEEFSRGRLDILLASHELAKQWIEELRDVDWSVVVVDECHKLKNPRSALTMALNSLHCTCRLGLSGTAIQNQLDEMWALLNWCSPGRFGSSKEWKERVSDPIKRGQDRHGSEHDLAIGRMAAQSLVQDTLPPFFLRRTKDLIKAQLPTKKDNVVFCPLTPTQIAVYKQILEEPEVNELRMANGPCECGRTDEDGRQYKRSKCCHTETKDGKRWNFHLFKYLSLLQRCSNHVALVFPDRHDNIPVTEASSQKDVDRKMRYLRQVEIVQRLFPQDWPTKQANKRNGFCREYCGKWWILRDLMRVWRQSKDKLLLFSMNLRLLDWLASFIEMEGFPFLRLDGSTPPKKRQILVDQFNRDPSMFCFLISTTAGGAGLNLTGANRVVVFDPHWNPAHDLQAMDRAYRFGQTRDVDVYRLIGQGSLEEVIYDRQLYKQQMGRIGYDASNERRYFRFGDERGMERLLELRENDHMTRDLVQACDMNEARAIAQMYAQQAEMERRPNNSDISDNETIVLPQDQVSSHDVIQQLLTRQGVRYTHRNDDLLGGNQTEDALTRHAISKVEQRPKRKHAADDQKQKYTSSWPPPRKRRPPLHES